MRFAERTRWEAGGDNWAERLRLRRAQGLPVLDLSVANPTACGLGPQGADFLAPLAAPGALRYLPEPFGMRPARKAVAGYYAELEAVSCSDTTSAPSADHICLTTSTSEAYTFLFRLLCDPGDEVLIGRPSYPLFDLLARMQDVDLREYPLFYEPGARASSGEPGGGWQIDFQALEEAITPRTRAVIVVHPNNPTGHYVAEAERVALRALCARHGLALIVDEVFLGYPLPLVAAQTALCRSFAAEASDCLCFVLSGLSKICAMPQAKLSWFAACGPPALVEEALERLEVIADTFLSVSGPTQHALPPWLAARGPIQEAIHSRVRANLRSLDERLQGTLADRLQLQGGWTVVLRVPAAVGGQEFAEAALERGVAVQPGALYGFPPGRCVLSLLTPPEVWQRGLHLLPIDS